jgi:hypothetical protein
VLQFFKKIQFEGVYMKRMLVLGLLISCVGVSLKAMEEESNIDKLTFMLAQKGEDLSVYEAIAINRFLTFFDTAEGKERMEKSIKKQFPILVSWIGERGKLFIKILKQENPYGFLTLQSLDDDEKRITFNLSVIPDTKYMGECINCVREHFPHIRILFTYARNERLSEKQSQLGFAKDDSYVPNPELIPDPSGFHGFRIDFDQSNVE